MLLELIDHCLQVSLLEWPSRFADFIVVGFDTINNFLLWSNNVLVLLLLSVLLEFADKFVTEREFDSAGCQLIHISITAKA